MDKPDTSKNPLIGIVGVCASGKSTLARRLAANGYNVRHIAQEHSYVQRMWQVITKPQILIYLDVSFPVTLQRRHANFWNEADYAEQQRRLEHARRHADFYLHTDALDPEQVLDAVIHFLQQPSAS